MSMFDPWEDSIPLMTGYWSRIRRQLGECFEQPESLDARPNPSRSRVRLLLVVIVVITFIGVLVVL